MSLNAIVWQEDNLFVAQCLEVDMASQGKSHDEALANLEEVADPYLEDEEAGPLPKIENLRLAQLSVKLPRSNKLLV